MNNKIAKILGRLATETIISRGKGAIDPSMQKYIKRSFKKLYLERDPGILKEVKARRKQFKILQNDN